MTNIGGRWKRKCAIGDNSGRRFKGHECYSVRIPVIAKVQRRLCFRDLPSVITG